MAKGKSFAAKTAQSQSTEGKVICPECKSEVKKIKLVLNRNSKAQTWAPKYEFKNICKCNEADIMAGKI